MEFLVDFVHADFLGKPAWLWLAFLGAVVALLAFDLGILHRDDRQIGVRESLMLSAIEVQRAYAQALLVDRKALKAYQEDNDALMATQTLKAGYRTDVEPILAMARLNAGGAVDPVAAYRRSGYRKKVAAERPAVSGGGGGIV